MESEPATLMAGQVVDAMMAKETEDAGGGCRRRSRHLPLGQNGAGSAHHHHHHHHHHHGQQQNHQSQQQQQQQRTPTAAEGTMLKYLTHKLRTHSLNEEPGQEKADDDHDSGTESDDEFQNGTDVADDEMSNAMDSFEEAPARDSAVPSDVDLGMSPPTSISSYSLPASSNDEQANQTYEFLLSLSQADHHSSEEELECINGPKVTEPTPSPRCPSRRSTGPEKRKWSEANRVHHNSFEEPRPSCSRSRHNSIGGQAADVTSLTYSAPASRTGQRETGSGSSDDELQDLCPGSRSGSAISQPLQFRSSPPTDAHKPGRSLSPPPKLFHASTAVEMRPQAHRPRSRPRPHSHYHSHASLDHFHHHNPHPQQFSTLPLQSHSQGQRHFFSSSSNSSFESPDIGDLDVVGACSPRKRHRPPQKLARPCLDFEKMQQMKTQAVTSWRHSSEHGKELSVFCW